MIRGVALFTATAALAALTLVAPIGATADGTECTLEPRAACFGIESVSTSLSTTQAGAHPDFTLSIEIAKDPKSTPNVFGLKDSYAALRNIRFNPPPGLIGDPDALGAPQQCAAQELVTSVTGAGCPEGSQIGTTTITAYGLTQKFVEPLYMMQPPGGDVVARLGTVAGIFPTFIDLRVRSESDYGLVADVRDAPTAAKLIKLESTFWGVPADPVHDEERCTVKEAFNGCVFSEARHPGSLPLPFMTNPTRCGVPLTMGVNASSWVEPELVAEKEEKTVFPTIIGCNKLPPYGPDLTVNPTNHHTASPTGLDLTIRLPKAVGPNVLEPAQTRDIRIDLPRGISINPGSADGLGVCSVQQVHLGERVDAQCPDAAKMAETEFEVGGLPRRMKGAVYLREPEPGNLFRIWIVADDLGAHVKLAGQLKVDEATGQIASVVLDNPQVPLREVKLLFKSGFRAPLTTPTSCGTYFTHYEFTPWSSDSAAKGDVKMGIDEGCATGGFAPKLSAGSRNPVAGKHSPFTFTINREDSEQNLQDLDVALPKGELATLSSVARCEGSATVTGACPAASRVGRTTVADGMGPDPLWVPQPGKDPTALYKAGPYKGAPLSFIAVVPAQAGPFDLGNQVVRTAVYVNPITSRATAEADPLPQIVKGIPVTYKTVNVVLDRSGFSLNPTSCARNETTANLTSTQGAVAKPSSPFRAVECEALPFKPKLFFRLRGGTHRGAHPSLRAVVKPRPGDANIASASVALPHSEFLDQGHIGTVCTRVQFAAHACPTASIYGHVVAKTPLFDETLSGPVYLRSSNHPLPDVVAALKGPSTLPVEVELAGRVDSVNGGIRNTFEMTPDAPVTSFVLTLKGGSKGLLVNSTDLCARAHRATADFTGQNGRSVVLRPTMTVSCHAGQ